MPTGPVPGIKPAVQPPKNANVGTVTTTSSMSQPQSAVTIVPGTGGVTNRLNADTRAADPNADIGINGGLPAMPSFPPTALTSELPGLGRAPGTQNAGKPLIVRSVAGVNDIVPISRNFPNRIATPFKDPVWVDQNSAAIDKLHSSVYVTPKGDRAIQLFITENNDPNAPVVQLTLIPRAIPGQTLVVQIEGAEGVTAANKPTAREERMPDEYTDQMLFLLREVARNHPPAGFTEENLTAAAANLVGGIQALPEKRFSGAAYDIYRYKLRNVGKERITLTEQSFFQKGVRAVAFFPLLQLSGGQETSVNIIVSKDGE
jgi:conjugal transfer pilus assembly protein TraK